jgi:hypothetical protein
MQNNKSRLVRLLPLIVLLFLNSAVTAQEATGNITFTFGDSYELPRKHDDIGFLGDESGYVQIGHDPHRSLSFQKFDNSLKLVKEQIVDLKDMPDDYQNVTFAQMGGKTYWFFCTWIRKEQVERLYAQEIDLANANVKGPAKEIASSEKLAGDPVTYGWYNYGITNKWNLYFTADSSKMLVQYRRRPEVKDDRKSWDIIGFQVFDQNLNDIWKKEIKMPYTEVKMDNEDYHVDPQGNVYTLARIYETDKNARKKPNYRFEILKWSKENAELTKIPFRFTDKFVSSARLTQDPQGHLLVVGYYSKTNNRTGSLGFYSYTSTSSTDGVFVLKLDQGTNELNNVMKGTYEFPASVLKQFESRRTQKRLEKKDDNDNLEADNLTLRNIVINGDGSIQVYGEEYQLIVRTYYTGRTTRTTYEYDYNDILAMSIRPDGELDWVVKVPKQQMGSRGTGDMSFKLFTHGGNRYLFFMDNMKNLDIQKDERPALHRDGNGGVLMVVKINEEGKMFKSKIFDVREEDKTIRVADFSDVAVDKMMGRAFHRRESQLAFINFK